MRCFFKRPLQQSQNSYGRVSGFRRTIPLKSNQILASKYVRRQNFSTNSSEEILKSLAFLEKLGYDEEISVAITESLLLPGTGISKENVFKSIETLAGRYEIGEDAGLEQLAKAVEQDLLLRKGKENVAFEVFMPEKGSESIKCSELEGMTLKDVVEHGRSGCKDILSEHLECACSGIMACSTCHVYVDEAWVERLNEISPVTEAEMDMIDLAFEPKDNSRLGCQIRLHKSLNGLKIHLPADSNNLFDHIPFQD